MNSSQSLHSLFLKPHKWPYLATRVLKAVRTRVRIKTVGLYSPNWYPREIRENLNSINLENTTPSFSFDQCFKEIENSNAETKVSLAGLAVELNEIPSVWSSSAHDNEVLFSSHRFHWVLQFIANQLNEDSYKNVKSIIENWLNSHQPTLAWEPYSVSERICHWITFLQLTHKKEFFDESFEKKVTLSLKEHTDYLINHLEYPASNIVNNHILNNARAVLFAGVFFNDKALIKLAHSILKREIPNHIDSQGFLKECSVHYQQLITKNILETTLMSSALDEKDFFNFLKPVCEKMLSASSYVLPSKLANYADFPKIGDISPDFPSNWFLYNKSVLGDWNKIWNFEKAKSLLSLKEIINSDQWLNLSQDSWDLITCLHPNKDSYPFGHGHDDFGSFCLYYEGQPVLIDQGRFSYESSSEFSIHNQIYGDQRSTQDFKIENEAKKVSWSFSKAHKRDVEISQTVSISETISNNVNGKLTISPMFACTHNENTLSLQSDKVNIQIKLDNASTINTQEIAIYPSYGKEEKTTLVTYESTPGEKVIKLSIEVIS